jgi:hypothetical protein
MRLLFDSVTMVAGAMTAPLRLVRADQDPRTTTTTNTER